VRGGEEKAGGKTRAEATQEVVDSEWDQGAMGGIWRVDHSLHR
jgi:hypothetical protein